MNRSYIAGCCVIVGAASLGYWIFADQLPSHRPPPPTLEHFQDLGDTETDKPLFFAARTTGDVIDLARAYDPTGEELDLHNLLHGEPVAELIPPPREAEPELGPTPREEERELLHAPQLVRSALPESGEEASSPPLKVVECRDLFSWITAALIADWLSGSLPLKGLVQD